METINNELIRSFNPCYDPSEKNIPDSETLPVLEWVKKYKKTVPARDIIWLLCRNEFMSDRDLRLFSVWCAREALKLVNNPDERSINACDIAEKFALGESTAADLAEAWGTAWEAVDAAADAAAAWAAARAARAACVEWAAARAACVEWAAARAARAERGAWAAMAVAEAHQLTKLLTYFK